MDEKLRKKLGMRGLFWGGGGLNLRVSPRPKFPIQFEWDAIIYRTSKFQKTTHNKSKAQR